MFIIFCYTFPALWLGYLVGIWLNRLLAEALLQLPSATVEGMMTISQPVFVLGLLLMLGGHLALAWELLANRHVRLNLDAFTTYFGAILVALGLLLLGWGGMLSDTLLALLIAPNLAAGLIRIAARFTETAFATLGVLLGLCATLAVLTWVTHATFL